MNTIQALLQDSGDFEYYTDPEIVNAARRVMGGIDLDPASSEIANQTVGATCYFSAEDNKQIKTLERNWGYRETPFRVWMNHPFSRGENACVKNGVGEYKCKKKVCQERGFHIDEGIPGNADWVNKLVSEFNAGHVSQACCITFAATSEDWFQPLYGGFMCYLSPRTNYYLPNGKKKKGVTKGSVVTYFGPKERREIFIREFSRFGRFPNA